MRSWTPPLKNITMALILLTIAAGCKNSSSSKGPSQGGSTGLSPGDSVSAPSPENGATNIRVLDTELSWTAPNVVDLSFSVFLGIDTLPADPIVITQSAKFTTPKLRGNSRYVWRIDMTDSNGFSITGPEWAFETLVQVPPIVTVDPQNPDPILPTQRFSIDITADDPGDTISLEVLGQPEGSRFDDVPDLTEAPLQRTFSWRTKATDIGLRLLTIISKDSTDAVAEPIRVPLSVINPFPKSISLAELDGSAGFRVDGSFPNDMAGWSVSGVGDVNGDGFDDFAFGAPDADPGVHLGGGIVYLIFGGQSVGANGVIDTSTLTKDQGVIIEGVIAARNVGIASSGLGDIDGDGFSDFIVSGPSDTNDLGESYVLFGAPIIGTNGALSLGNLDGDNGIRIPGRALRDRSGQTCSGAGDINGDGFPDILIGAKEADASDIKKSGETYLIFGGPGLRGSATLDLDLLGPSTGLIIRGIDVDDFSGTCVSGLGDINGDGRDDLIIGAPGADPRTRSAAGEAYILYGREDIADNGPFDLRDLNSAQGILIQGSLVGERAGTSVTSFGDVNGDGYGDIGVGSPFLDAQGIPETGAIYLIFGGPSIGENGVLALDTLDGTNGIRYDGTGDFDYVGSSMGGASDVNGDGLGDLLIGSGLGSEAFSTNGKAFLLFGSKTMRHNGGALSLDDVQETDGRSFLGLELTDNLGVSVATLGDINGDGFSDLMLGAPFGDAGPTNPKVNAGEGYVLFGRPSSFIASATAFDAEGSTVAHPIGSIGDGSDADAPATKCWIAWSSGTASKTRVEMLRTRDGIFGLPGETTRADLAEAHWFIESDRTAWDEAEITLSYEDSQVAGLDEEALRIYRGPTPRGWSVIEDVVRDPSKNLITFKTRKLGYFTIGQ